MTDRELLEAAARAAGMVVLRSRLDDPMWQDLLIDCRPAYPQTMGWNALRSDSDALRLAVKLGICFGPNLDGDMAVCFGSDGRNITEPFGADPYAATRRAVVRAAAALAPTTGATDGRS